MKNHELPPKAAIWAAGGVVYRLAKDGSPEYQLIHRPRYRDWTVPKGKLDSRETFLDAAVREVREETSSKVNIGPAIGTISYETPAGNQKVVRYWLLEHKSGKFKRNSEVDEIVWLPRGKALRRLTYTRGRAVLRRAHELLTSPEGSRIHLVRHAEAGKRSAWKGNDKKRPLSKAGRKQTAAIHDVLVEIPITSVATSPYLRCRQTVAGIGKTLGLRVDDEPALEEYTSPEDLLKRIGKMRGESAVLCSHGDVISGTIGLLAASKVKIKGPMEWAKGSIWVLDSNGGRVRRATYIPPP